MFIDINKIGSEGLVLETALDLPDLKGAGGESQPVRLASLVATVVKGSRGTEILGRLNLSRKPVCRQDCLGLCSGCGVNRNTAECRCAREEIDLRLAPLLKFWDN